MKKPKILVILGPTASGKSALAIRLAKKLKGEIVSADSRQVYKGLDIGTGKVTLKEMRGVPHHMLDVVSPKHTYSVAEYAHEARQVITDIIARGKLPIICGGTGLYIDTLLYGLEFPNVPPNPTLRKKLANKTATELFAMLQKKDPRRADTIDPHNPVRLIRALEIVEKLGAVPTTTIESPFDARCIGILFDDKTLQDRIKKRLTDRIKAGMIKEVQKLHTNGLTWKRLELLGLEYRYIARFLQKKMKRQEMIDTLFMEIWHYAKRQMTWFKRNKDIVWLKPKQLTKYVPVWEK